MSIPLDDGVNISVHLRHHQLEVELTKMDERGEHEPEGVVHCELVVDDVGA